MSTPPLTAEDLSRIVCPVCHQSLQLELAVILCKGCGRRYPVVDGIPVLTGLREDLMKSGLDSWQAADLISSFLSARGYGVSTQDARTAAFRIESITCSLRCLQEELEKIAYVM